MPEKNITHLIVNNLGGITSLINNLIQYKGQQALPQELVLLNVAGNPNTPALLDKTEAVKEFSFNPRYNWYHEFGKLASLLSEREGVLVSNDVYDLLMLRHFNIPRKIAQIVHDGYNVRLSIEYDEVIDAFICHSLFFYEILCQVMPHRRDDIFHIPYGIPLLQQERQSRDHQGPLKLMFLGRHDVNKGIFDLHAINARLKEWKVPVEWLILGKGPETEKVKQIWKDEHNVRFYTPPTYQEVLSLSATQDIFVFPTRFEGFPVALLETMSMGTVPVATDLPGGIREVVRDGITGYRCKQEHIHAFAEWIKTLSEDRSMLENMSKAACDTVYADYDARTQSPKYQELFSRLAADTATPRHHSVKRKIGSRLDQTWIPNTITKFFRKAL